MLIDIRYHLTSLVAIFLALAVGILVGSSFIAGSSVKGLEKEFSKLRAENRQQVKAIENLREEIKKHSEFERAAAPVLVNGQLTARRIAIIQTGDYSEAAQRAKSIIEEAGGRVASVTTLSNLESRAARRRAVRAVELIAGETEEQDPIGRVLEIVARCIAAGGDSEALGVLEDEGLLSRAGDYDRRVLHVALIGGCKQERSRRAEHVDLVLIDKLIAEGAITLVGAEPLDVGTSYISVYHRKAIPTVDNVDQPIGQVGLVYAMAGETGNFGVKRSADRIAPEYLESGLWRFGYRR